MSRYTAKTSFDHDGRTYQTGESVDVSEPTARELSARGLIDGFEGDKSAPAPANKMAPDHSDKGAVTGGVDANVADGAGDIFAGEESVNTRGPKRGK